MNAQRSVPLCALAVLGLLAACGDPAGPNALASSELAPGTDVVVLPDGGGLEVKAAVKVEDLGDESIREHVEVTAYFAGLQPVDPDAAMPEIREIQLEFEVDVAGITQPCWVFTIAGDAWSALDGGGFVVELEDPQSIPGALEVRVVEAGTPGVDLTGGIAAVEGRLAFRADLKAWELKLELVGIDAPAADGSAFAPIAGAVRGVLRIGPDELASGIRENEAFHDDGPLAIGVETGIRQAGAGMIRELTGIVARFPSVELQPDPEIREVEAIRLAFELDIAGTDQPCWLFLISGDGWEEGDGGGFKIEQPDWLQVLVIREGQVLADLTDRIREAEATLNFLLDEKIWELRLEIGGEAAPVEQHAPAFSPIAGAGMVSLEVGDGLELLPAVLREAEAVFGIITPTD